jgi:hypothetical protein
MNRGFDHYSPLARDEGLYSYGEWRAALAATPTPRAEHEIESCRPETRASLCCALPGFYSRPLQSTVATSAWLLAACWLLPTYVDIGGVRSRAAPIPPASRAWQGYSDRIFLEARLPRHLRRGSHSVRGQRRGLAGTSPWCWGSGAAEAGLVPTPGSRLLRVCGDRSARQDLSWPGRGPVVCGSGSTLDAAATFFAAGPCCC